MANITMGTSGSGLGSGSSSNVQTYANRSAVYAVDPQFAGGAKFDGTTDDTAALQALITYITANGCRGILPRGTAKITAQLNFSNRPGWELVGASRLATTIKQFTSNIPIFNLGSDTGILMHGWALADMTLTYNTTQPSTNTAANPILFSKDGLQGQIRNVGFFGGSWAIRVASGIGAPWGTSFDDLVFGNGLTGGAMDWSLSANAVPNNRFGRFYVDAANMVGPIFTIKGYNFTIGAIEFIAANHGPNLMTFMAGSRIDIGTIKLENGVYAATANLLQFDNGCYARIGHLTVGGDLNMSVTGGTINMVRLGTGNTRTHIGFIEAGLTSNPAGNPWVLDTGTGATARLGDYAISGGWQLQNNGSSNTGDQIRVDSLINGRISADKGDANYTVTLGDPNTVMFQTAFTAARTITLPSTGPNMCNGLYYDIVADGAINGANTLIVKSNTVTLRTQTTDKVMMRFAWRRNATATSGWQLVNYHTLP